MEHLAKDVKLPSVQSAAPTASAASKAALAKQQRAQLDAAIAELIDESAATEDFENCMVYRNYKNLLANIDAAVSGEKFEEAIKLRADKKAIDDKHPEIAAKRDSMPLPTIAAPAPAPAAAAAPGSPAPRSSISAATSSSTTVEKPPPPVKKLTAAERDALWQKLGPKPVANDKKRTSWDGNFTLQAAASQADDSTSSSDDEALPPPPSTNAATPAKPTSPPPANGEKKKKKKVKKKSKKADKGAEGEKKKKKKKPKENLSKEERNKALTEALAKAKKRAIAQAALNSTWGGNKKTGSTPQLDSLFAKSDKKGPK